MENLNQKYRPQTFADVVGQKHAVSMLKSIAKAGGCRSILLNGSWGSGKTTMSRILAKALNCEKFKSTGDVCNKCDGCNEASSGISTTYKEFDTSSVGNVEFVRSLPDRLACMPTGKNRLIVFDECHTASKQALNGLLKLIEEGIPNTTFLFATTEDVLPTIKSRSIVVDISPIPLDLVKERVRSICDAEGITATDAEVDQIAMKSRGHMRDALSILQSFSLIGDKAIETSYSLIYNYMKEALKGGDCNEVINNILGYPITDIRASVSVFLRNMYCDPQLANLLRLKNWRGTKGCLTDVMVDYFYSPAVATAMTSEEGMDVALRRFGNMFKGL